jgi:hypothetical protein
MDPRFVGSNTTDDDGFLRVIKICSTAFFGGEEKPSAPCYKILWHVKYVCRVTEILHQLNSRTFHVNSLLNY